MSVKKLFVLLAVSFAFASNAFAAGKSREFSIDANYIDVQGQGAASVLNVAMGNYLTPKVAIMGELMSNRNFGYTGTSIGFGGKFYFMDGFRGDLVPFAGVGLALRQSQTATDNNHASTQYDVNMGVSFFMTDVTTVDAKLRFLNFNDSSPAITMFTAGFTQRF